MAASLSKTLHSLSDIAAIATAHSGSVHTVSVDANDNVLYTPASGSPIVQTGVSASLNDPARAQAIYELASDQLHRKGYKSS